MKTLRPRLTPPAPRLKTARAIRDKRYSPDKQVRAWYRSSRWLKLRMEVLVRDLFFCQRTGVLLVSGKTAPNSAVVHHKTPHKGDERLFWDINNLEAVSKEWHDSEAQAQEKRAWRSE